MFNDKQLQVLSYELDNSRIKSRTKGNIELSYLEGFDIIDTANKIFGYGNWSYTLSSLDQVSQESNPNQNFILCYKALVKVTIHDLQHSKHIEREDVVFGLGIAKTLADAHESAAKEAVTDALKRSLRSVGNQFGNSLYDKSKNSERQSNIQHPYNTQTQQTQPMQQTQQQHPQSLHQEYASLYNLGLSVVTQGEYLIVIGEDLFSKKDSIKSFGFRWDGKSKQWYKPLEQQAA